MSDSPIIPILDPTPTQDEWADAMEWVARHSDLRATPSEKERAVYLEAKVEANSRVRIAREAIEWARSFPFDIHKSSYSQIDEALAAHDAAIKERKP